MIYRVVGFLLVFALIGGGLLILFTRPEGPAEVSLEKTQPPKADLKLHTVHYTETDHGRMVWELVADSVQVFIDDLSTVFENTQVTFYGARGQLYKLSAKRGVLENATKNITISGDVLGTTSAGDTIKTDSLHYLAADRVIETDDSVLLTRSGLIVTGVGLECRMQEGTIILLSDVKGSIDSLPVQ